MSSEELRLSRPPSELIADVRELLELYGAIVDPLIERLHPAVFEALGNVELAYEPIGLRLQSETRTQISALPGDERKAFQTHLDQPSAAPPASDTQAETAAVQPSVEDVLAQIASESG